MLDLAPAAQPLPGRCAAMGRLSCRSALRGWGRTVEPHSGSADGPAYYAIMRRGM